MNTPFPWGISHVHRFVAHEDRTKSNLYYVSCNYRMRIKLPKYVRKLLETGLIGEKFFQDLISTTFTANSFRGQQVSIYFVNLSIDNPELTVVVKIPDRYFKEVAHSFVLRCNESKRDILDYCRAFVFNNMKTEPKLRGWAITKSLGIYYPRQRGFPAV